MYTQCYSYVNMIISYSLLFYILKIILNNYVFSEVIKAFVYTMYNTALL